MMMSRRVLLGAAIAAPVAAVVPLLLPKPVVAVLEADSTTAEALLYFKHVHGRVGRFADRMANWDKEHAATGFKPIGWQQRQDDSWYNEDTGALVSQEMIDDLRCSIELETDSDKRVYMVLYGARPI